MLLGSRVGDVDAAAGPARGVGCPHERFGGRTQAGGGFTEVADRVWVGRYPQWDTTIGVVHGSDGLLVVDTRGAYAHGVELARRRTPVGA